MLRRKKTSFSKEVPKPDVLEKAVLSKEEAWAYVPLDNFCLPAMPASGTADGVWTSFKSAFQTKDKGEKVAERAKRERLSLPSSLDEFVLPEVDFEAGVSALDAALSTWRAAVEPEYAVVYVLGQPYSGNGEILRLWAKQNDAQIIEAPDYDAILAGSVAFLERFPGPDKLWLIPNLERFFLRHVDGLKAIRKLLELAETGKLGKGMVGCQSFAWAYLERLFKPSSQKLFTLQAFDKTKFVGLLGQSLQRAEDTTFKFFNHSNDREIAVLSPEDESIDPFFAKLAAICRGNLPMQVKLWREHLGLEPQHLTEEQSDLEDAAEKANERLIWVSPEISESLYLPTIDEDLVILLHALILHDGLPEDVLYRILPFSEMRARTVLSYLLSSQLVKSSDGLCEVRETVYFSVRKLLSERDYLVDKL